MEQRTRFALDYVDGLFTMAELCARYHVSRETGYKWFHRYKAEGLGGLSDRSRRPHSCAHQTPDAVEALLVACREKHPYWDPKKLRAYLQRRHPTVRFPVESTIGMSFFTGSLSVVLIVAICIGIIFGTYPASQPAVGRCNAT